MSVKLEKYRRGDNCIGEERMREAEWEESGITKDRMMGGD
uniref:OJ000114_01.7 protein n=1 Tax=Oryza sativa subsp. japonica TaxID=39947 RepID=Q7XQH0_ORYSJ|nr:OJ000114_01.7 [Oryza sativa Japonica Group]